MPWFWIWVLILVFAFLLHYYANALEVPKIHYKKTKKNEQLRKHLSSFVDKTFWPSWFTLGNVHLQTIWNVKFRPSPSIGYNRKVLKLKDGGIIPLDFAGEDENDITSSPFILMFTGYTGSSQVTINLHLQTGLMFAFEGERNSHLGQAVCKQWLCMLCCSLSRVW